jgi:GAF domain-containing protein
VGIRLLAVRSLKWRGGVPIHPPVIVLIWSAPFVIAPAYARHEAQRLQALRALLILDTPPEERFDRIVRFAIDEFEVPMAAISLVDDERQWFKASHGLPMCQTARDISFCGHAILRAEVMLVPDTLLDPRFFDNPFVQAPPRVRFYAGAPLTLRGGEAVGTLCLFDTRPRQLDRIDIAVLSALRDLVVEQLTQSKVAACS